MQEYMRFCYRMGKMQCWNEWNMLPLGLYGLNKCAQHLFRIGALFRAERLHGGVKVMF